ncbi:hypothetical protein ACMHYO_12095 [Allopusillimonas ginsengisoli]|uniref:hypothetical protein n=1 Tax=Allopusillimonas ginsengisoli TaxID=453575 RepID=UPI0039C057FD
MSAYPQLVKAQPVEAARPEIRVSYNDVFGLAQVLICYTRGKNRFLRVLTMDTLTRIHQGSKLDQVVESVLTYSDYYTYDYTQRTPYTVTEFTDKEALRSIDLALKAVRPEASDFVRNPTRENVLRLQEVMARINP